MAGRPGIKSPIVHFAINRQNGEALGRDAPSARQNLPAGSRRRPLREATGDPSH
jgi:hypothetical protein